MLSELSYPVQLHPLLPLPLFLSSSTRQEPKVSPALSKSGVSRDEEKFVWIQPNQDDLAVLGQVNSVPLPLQSRFH